MSELFDRIPTSAIWKKIGAVVALHGKGRLDDDYWGISPAETSCCLNLPQRPRRAHITSYQYGGHYKVKYTAFQKADVAKMKRHMEFGSCKALEEMVESWLVVESQSTPPAWCDVFSAYLYS